MAKRIENVVVGKSCYELFDLFALNESDWEDVEKEKHYSRMKGSYPKY